MSIYSFGSSFHHELGFGAIDKPNVLLPTKIDLNKYFSSGTIFKQAIGGKNHIAILFVSSLNHSLVLTCGSNERQQLGREGSCSKLLPVNYFNSHLVNQVCSGFNHNLVLTDSGQVFSWGCNLFGQLGTESTCDSVGQPSLIKALAHEHVVHISCGSNHCLALAKNGLVFSWGANNYGQCGVESNQSKLIKPTIITSLEASPILFISLGGFHSLALSYTGVLYVWGKNEFGQLGLGHNQAQHKPTTLNFLEGQKISHINCGEDFSAAITEEGGLFTWGAGMYGQLGHGDKKNDLLPRRVTEMMGSKVVQVSCGRCHTLILDSDSKVYSTGLNGCGQLGQGNRENKLVPTLINLANLRKYSSKEVLNEGQEFKLESDFSKNTQVYQISTSHGDHSFLITDQTDRGLSCKDYRILEKKILEIDNSKFELLTKLDENSSIPMEYLEYIEKVLSSVASWNASFIVKNEKLPAIDWIEVKKGFQYLREVKNERINELIQAIITNLLIKKLPILENERISLEVLRVYLIVPMYHLFEQQFKTQDGLNLLISNYSKQFLKMIKFQASHKALEIWLGTVKNEVILRRLLKIYKKNILELISEQKRIYFNQQQSQGLATQENESVYMFDSMDIENQINTESINNELSSRRLLRRSSRVNVDCHLQQNLALSLECLQFIYKISQKSKLICYKEFYISEIIDLVDIKYDYIYWLSKSRRPCKSSDVYFCSYPFIFDAKAKSLILETDSAIQQKNAAENALYRSILCGPIAVLTEDPHLFLSVSRRNLIRDTIDQFLDPNHTLNFKKPLKVRFEGEDAIDAGSGMKKEFFLLLLKEILDPKYGMFIEYKDTNTIWFNPLENEDLVMYELIGIICGLAIYNQAIIYLPFPLVLYKKILGESYDLDDLASIDPILEKNLRAMLSVNLTKEEFDATYEDITFTVSLECYGAPVTFPLVSNGENKTVNFENRSEYVNAYWNFILNDCILSQFQFFQKGFLKVVDREILGFFHAEELLELVTGQEAEDWKELEEGTSYKAPFHRNHPTIVKFWKVFHSLSGAQKKKFLLFLTGSDRVPIQGMKSLKLGIQPMKVSDNHFPVAHTCFNILDLPEVYSSVDKLKQQLIIAIENTLGFTLA